MIHFELSFRKERPIVWRLRLIIKMWNVSAETNQANSWNSKQSQPPLDMLRLWLTFTHLWLTISILLPHFNNIENVCVWICMHVWASCWSWCYANLFNVTWVDGEIYGKLVQVSFFIRVLLFCLLTFLSLWLGVFFFITWAPGFF